MAVRIRIVAAFISSAAAAVPLLAELNCSDVTKLAAMASAKSATALSVMRADAPVDFRADVIVAFRSFQLQRSRRSAEDLLRLIPKTEAHQTALMTLGDSLCDAESEAQMRALARVRDRFDAELARAVLIAPEHMPTFIGYAQLASLDPHSDYAVQAAGVCRRAHKAFINGMNQLATERRELITAHVIDAVRCRALALPEADQ